MWEGSSGMNTILSIGERFQKPLWIFPKNSICKAYWGDQIIRAYSILKRKNELWGSTQQGWLDMYQWYVPIAINIVEYILRYLFRDIYHDIYTEKKWMDFHNKHLPAVSAEGSRGKILILPREVRWNTMADAIQTFLEYRGKLVQLCQNHKDNIDFHIIKTVNTV